MKPAHSGHTAAMLLVLALLAAACGARRVAAPANPPGLAAPAASATVGAPAAATAAPLATPVPATDTPMPAPTSTPAPVLRQLTSGGCCVQPFWSPDGSQVLFIDRPDAASPSGIWGVPAAGGEQQFITDRLGIASRDRTLIAYPESGQTYIERVATGERWVAPTAGRSLSFSPDGTQIAWQVAYSSAGFDRRRVDLWVANVDGTGARIVAQLTGGGFSGWFPDGGRLLISGRAEDAEESFLAALNLADGSLSPIVQRRSLRGSTLSPEGGWLVFQVAFSGDPSSDGLWVVRTDGSGARRLDLFGAYRWRAEGRLMVIPLEPGAGSQRLVEVDAATGLERPLTDPAITPIRIAGGDWSLSPDGSRVVFVNADDRNLWVIDLVN